jgi:hypothetical protein
MMKERDKKVVQSYEASIVYAFVVSHQLMYGRHPEIKCSCGLRVQIRGHRTVQSVEIGVIHPQPFCKAFGSDVPLLAYLLNILSSDSSGFAPLDMTKVYHA